MPLKKPTRISVRAYQVGFGDCFLLSFHYATETRRVLIDCGSTGAPKWHSSNLLINVAKDIQATCGGKIEGIVATHRHKDHISGFETGTKKRPKAGDTLRSLRPEVVVQPWTEDPKAKTDATRPTVSLPPAQASVRALDSMHEFSQRLLAELGRSAVVNSLGKRAREQLAFLGEDNLKNKSAVENLMTMARTKKGQEYVSYGAKTGLEALLPGVQVHVLGPPTVDQTRSITKQTDESEAEFWHLMVRCLDNQASAPAGRTGIFASAKTLTSLPEYARWLIPRIRDLRGSQLLQLVRMLDQQMNNTSVILLFECGSQRLLFPGDAQLENWMYALKGAPEDRLKKTHQRLAGTTLYKVGHHGSLNATPKSLWRLFKNRSTSNKPGRLISMVSTMAGKHGHADHNTEVPRRLLVNALRDETQFLTTQTLTRKTDLFLEVDLKP